MASPTNNLLPLTGDPIVDASRSGSYWQLGPNSTITWSISDGFNGEFWNNPDKVAEQVGGALNAFAQYIPVNFEYEGYFQDPIAAGARGSDINVTMDGEYLAFASDDQWALGFFPDTSFSNAYASRPGDVYLNLNSEANYLSSYDPGSKGWWLIIHELGHALGLKHTHDGGGRDRPTLPDIGLGSFDQDLFSIMSYNDTFEFSRIKYDPATPMLIDVIGLQSLYGTNENKNTGDTIYDLGGYDLYYTIWDAGGTDTVSAETADSGWYIQLPNAQLSEAVPEKFGYANEAIAADQDAPETATWLEGEIEHATGSAYEDTLGGNSLANTLRGRAGDDLFLSSFGDDAIYGGSGYDAVVYEGARSEFALDREADAIMVTQTTAGWSDQVDGVEELRFANTTVFTSEIQDAPTALSPGDDTFTVTSGTDSVDAGLGFDVAVIDRDRAETSIAVNNDEVSVEGAGIEATLRGFERLSFDGLTLGFDDLAKRVYRLYEAAFDRDPDQDGLGYWIEEIEKGMTFDAASARFIASPEFKDAYGSSLTDTEFVDIVYQNVLDRQPDERGRNYWLEEMASGADRAEILARFSDSEENRSKLTPETDDGVWFA